MPAYNKFNNFVGFQNSTGAWSPGTDVLKLLLSNTAPSSTMAVKADITEITATNGYTAGGAAVTVTNSAQSGGTYTLASNGLLFTGSSTSTTAGFGPLQYAVLYDNTASSAPLVAWWDYGSAITVKPSETLAWNPNGSTANGSIFTEA